jgi:hypothetical protein
VQRDFVRGGQRTEGDAETARSVTSRDFTHPTHFCAKAQGGGLTATLGRGWASGWASGWQRRIQPDVDRCARFEREIRHDERTADADPVRGRPHTGAPSAPHGLDLDRPSQLDGGSIIAARLAAARRSRLVPPRLVPHRMTLSEDRSPAGLLPCLRQVRESGWSCHGLDRDDLERGLDRRRGARKRGFAGSRAFGLTAPGTMPMLARLEAPPIRPSGT